ncbi:type VI secretion system-associated protein TagF [Aquabacter sp. CN5-332]|uniref:type VI secretion system-associated protein TagF n=1 Tax=Aquabacter sp. CN5-332 TaxID=3156608 RepID=UPI0032B4F456
MTAPAGSRGGLYGKIPSKDDFVRRNLPMSFVTPWDAWLSRMMMAGAERTMGAWNAIYLTSPPWRFALDPGIVGPEGWIGVLASSVDRFGRAFPFTVAVPFVRDFGLLDLNEETRPFTSRLEALTLQVIEGSLDVDAATDTIGSFVDRFLPPPAPEPVMRMVQEGANRSDRVWVLTGRKHNSVASAASDLLTWTLRADATQPVGLSCWWHEGWGDLPPVWLMARGLPGADVFERMMDGKWAGPGSSQRGLP